MWGGGVTPGMLTKTCFTMSICSACYDCLVPTASMVEISTRQPVAPMTHVLALLFCALQSVDGSVVK